MASRKMRRTSRKNRKARSRRMRGGMAPINHSLAGSSASNLSLGQGQQYASYHTAQHGGQAPLSAITSSALPQEMHASAGILPLGRYITDIQGLRDPGQAGGRRRRVSKRRVSKRRVSKSRARKSRARKVRKSRKSRKNTRRSRKQAGGNFVMNPADVGAPDMLLDGKAATNAMRGMNPEWALASDPKAFIPKA